MKTTFATLTLATLLSAAGTTAALAHQDYSEGGTYHNLSHLTASTGQTTPTQLSGGGYTDTSEGAMYRNLALLTGSTGPTTAPRFFGGSNAVSGATQAGLPAASVQKVIPLKNGSTLYVLQDGKMAMEDGVGRTARMKEGEVMISQDGQQIAMHGDEVMRLDSILHDQHRGN